jgi:hypothetical protein
MSILSSSDEYIAYYTKRLQLRALYDGASWLGVSALSHLRMEADPVSETLELNPVILRSIVRHVQDLSPLVVSGLCLRSVEK